MILNSCEDAIANDQDMVNKGLMNVTYAPNETCADSTDYDKYISHTTLRTKVMTKDVSNPNQISERNN